MTLLPVSLHRQQQQADCLAACAAMVLDYLQRPIPYKHLLRLLRVDAIGTPFRHLRYLESPRVSLTIANGDMLTLHQNLQNGRPLIIAVDTAELPYWHDATDHAVVVVGVDDNHVYLLDPDSETAPQVVPLAEFELAWLGKDYLYAVMQRVE